MTKITARIDPHSGAIESSNGGVMFTEPGQVFTYFHPTLTKEELDELYDDATSHDRAIEILTIEREREAAQLNSSKA